MITQPLFDQFMFALVGICVVLAILVIWGSILHLRQQPLLACIIVGICVMVPPLSIAAGLYWFMLWCTRNADWDGSHEEWPEYEDDNVIDLESKRVD